MTDKIIIKHRDTGAVLFEGEAGMTIRQTLEKATFAKANLGGADLRGADLRGADLGGADLGGANLRGANLRGANLRGANLRGANLYGADLYGADLRGADLYGANLGGKKLAGARPFIQIGPIGSRSDYLLAFITDKGVMIRAGCFFNTRDQFELQLTETHGDNQYAQEYRAALVLIDKHAELWPAEAAEVAEPVAA